MIGIFILKVPYQAQFVEGPPFRGEFFCGCDGDPLVDFPRQAKEDTCIVGSSE